MAMTVHVSVQANITADYVVLAVREILADRVPRVAAIVEPKCLFSVVVFVVVVAC